MSFSGIAKPNLTTGHFGQGFISIMKSIYDNIQSFTFTLLIKFNISLGVSLTYAQNLIYEHIALSNF